MTERVSRKDDERLYNPRIHSRHIRRLHRISELTGEPMTVLIDRILREFVERYEVRSVRITQWEDPPNTDQSTATTSSTT